MRIARILLLALFGAAVVLGGIVVAALIGSAKLILRAFQPRRVSAPRPAPAARRPEGDIIEVTATEVRSEPR